MKGHQMLAKLRKDQENEEGFTLIELLVVVIIIGILAAIAIPAFLNQRERAYQAALVSDIRNGALEIEAFGTARNGKYPTGTQLTGAAPDHNFDEELDLTEPTLTNVNYYVSDKGTAFCLTGTRTDINDGKNNATYSTALNGMQGFAQADFVLATHCGTAPTGEAWVGPTKVVDNTPAV